MFAAVSSENPVMSIMLSITLAESSALNPNPNLNLTAESTSFSDTLYTLPNLSDNAAVTSAAPSNEDANPSPDFLNLDCICLANSKFLS